MKTEIVVMIAGMALLTYLPRVLPVFLLEKMTLNRQAEKFLRLIPYTAMAALIFPGILGVDPANSAIGALGGLVAVFVAWLKPSVPLVVLFSVLATMSMYLLGA